MRPLPKTWQSGRAIEYFPRDPSLANYRSRGFVPVTTYVEHRDTSRPSPGPWRGSR